MASIKNYKGDKKITTQNQFARPKDNTKTYMSKQDMEERIIDWTTFYRRNLNAFIEHYFGIELHMYQIIWIYLMGVFNMIVIVGCRASAKSFLIAIFACAKAVLYPGSKIVIGSATKKQSKLIVTEKIQKELIPMSPNLAREIKSIKINTNDIEVIFMNNSSIVVVPATDNARGQRATVLIYEEFRMIKKEIIDSVLSPFLMVRPAPYLKNPEYEHLQEEPIEIYISSAWIKSHWVWDHMRLTVKEMYDNFESILFGFDYAITLKHGIRTRKQLVKEKKKLGRMSFMIEYENIMMGESENAYFKYDMFIKNQKLKKAFYPMKHIDVIENKKNKYAIKRQNGEIRIVSVDIAMVSGKENDNTIISLLRLIPQGDYYERQLVFLEAMNGQHTMNQAIRIKQLFYDFDADYCVIDGHNAGLSVVDTMGLVLQDDQRDCEYPAWTCFNDDKIAERIKNSNAKPVVFSIKASERLNHEIALAMKDVLDSKKIKLLINPDEARDYLSERKEYMNASTEDKVNYEIPYEQTNVLITEMVNLSYEIKENSRIIKLKEPRSGRKDRYSSVSYGNYFASLLERDLQDNKTDDGWDDYLIFGW